jgi:hypothetical protein
MTRSRTARWRRGATPIIAATAAVAAKHPDVNSYTIETLFGCQSNSIAFSFEPSPTWQQPIDGATFQQVFTGAATNWNQLRSPSGGQYVTVGGGTTVVTVRWADIGGGYANANPCSPTIQLNDRLITQFQADPAGFRAIVRHEVGHILGLQHTGTLDSYADGRVPFMSTCQTIAQNGAHQLSADDGAAIAARNASGAEMSANFGFENSATHLWMTALNNVVGDTYLTTSAWQGTYGYKFRAAAGQGSNAQLISHINVHRTAATTPARLVASARARREDNSASGNVSVAFKYRTVDYSNVASCNYAGPGNPNNRLSTSPWTYGPESKWAPSTAWSANVNSSSLVLGAVFSLNPSADAIDAGAVFRSYLTGGGQTKRANLDNFGLRRCDACA